MPPCADPIKRVLGSGGAGTATGSKVFVITPGCLAVLLTIMGAAESGTMLRPRLLDAGISASHIRSISHRPTVHELYEDSTRQTLVHPR